MRTTLDICLNGLLALLSLIIPKNAYQVVLGSRYGYDFSGNSKYLYLFLLSQADCAFSSVLWITRNRAIYNELRRQNYPVVLMYSLAGFIAILRAKYLVTTYNTKDISYFQVLPGRFCKIQTYHGLPLKGPIPDLKMIPPRPIGFHLFRMERRSYNAFITTSESTRNLERNFLFKRIEVLGYPRNDIFFDLARTYQRYTYVFRLNEYRKIVLYCPTFRDRPSEKVPFTGPFLDQLNSFLATQNFLLLYSGHPQERASLQLGQYSNIKGIGDAVSDIQDLLVDIDILITDYSSVAMDFLLLDRPIIFYPYDYAEYAAQRGFRINYFEDLPGPFIANEEQLLKALTTMEQWSSERYYRKKYDALRGQFHKHRDANSCERLYSYMQRL